MHTHQMGAEEQTKKLGVKNNDMKAKQPRWRVECGRDGRGVCYCTGSLVCLLVCVCAFVCSMRASAKFTGLSTLIISTHWRNNGPDPMCNTSHLNENFTFCVKQSCSNRQACFCFVFKAAEVAQTEGEDALGAARKRMCH